MENNPHQLAVERVEMAGEYARLSEQLGIILSAKPREWLLLRENCKSDTAAEKKWAQTDAGVEETIIRLKLKSLEKQMSAIRSYLDVLQGEARNQY